MKNTVKEYREKVLRTMREFEKQFNPVDQYEIINALGELYEEVRALVI